MPSNLLASIGNYLQSAGAIPLLPSDLPEEGAPDLPIATSSSPAREITRLELPPFPNDPALFRFFVDGVQRTVATAEVTVNNVRVLLHLAHLIAGAMERVDNELRPHTFREALVLIFPYQALQAIDPAWSARTPPGRELSSAGQIYSIIQGGDPLYSDSSVSLELSRDGRSRRLLEPGHLIRTGDVRQKALNRSKELLRIMEVGVVWELRQQNPDDWILLDGPVAPPLKYGRLVDVALQGLQDIARPDVAFDFLHRVVGAVKRVQIIPEAGLEAALHPGPNLTIPVYRFGDVIVKEDDAVAKEILSAFLWLRRELAGEISAIWSSVSGLARIDVPLPAVLDNNRLRNDWNTLDEEALLNLLGNPSSFEHQRLKQIMQAVIIERWPVPSSNPTRMLTELFPVGETELWLTSQLRSVYEMRQP